MTSTTALWLATAPSDKSSRLLGDILPWVIILIGAILAGGVLIYLVRRWMAAETSSNAKAGGFSLEDLRELHRQGQLTDEQFQAAKAQMIGRLAGPNQHQPAPHENPSSPGNQQQSSS